MTEPVDDPAEAPAATDAADPALAERWRTMPVRERGRLIRAVRAGREVPEPDRALAALIAQRELDRVAAVVHPGRVRVWRAFQVIAAVVALLAAISAGADGSLVATVFYGAAALLFGTSALLARRRLHRQVGRLVAARDANSS